MHGRQIFERKFSIRKESEYISREKTHMFVQWFCYYVLSKYEMKFVKKASGIVLKASSPFLLIYCYSNTLSS
jgi:hypothetical protein